MPVLKTQGSAFVEMFWHRSRTDHHRNGVQDRATPSKRAQRNVMQVHHEQKCAAVPPIQPKLAVVSAS
eukprot:m.297011 g.297011  ORF g.297011 m.297011 type:complete len:68 (-) comp20073_c2_seq1:889-1092(-)